MSEDKKALMPYYMQAGSNLGEKISLIQDADASGETAAVYDEWRTKSGRTKNSEVFQPSSGFPAPGYAVF